MKEYRTFDKSKWERGEWDQEPDKAEWRDEATKLPCLIVRNRMGALCGYVGVPPGHPWHGKHYEHLGSYPDVHGGLTFADECQPSDNEAHGICHVPESGEAANVWWLGFDCSHAGDLMPQTDSLFRGLSERGYDMYRNVAYVQAECAKLAAQVNAAGQA